MVAWRNGAPVRLQDVAKVDDSVEDEEARTEFNGGRSIIVSVQRQPDANTVAVTDAIQASLPEFRRLLPPTIELSVLSDRSESIRDSVHDVQVTLLLTAVLVILVILAFLRTWRATFIPAVALPLSIIGTFAGMAMFDFSLDNVSLFALTLALGFVVDDAIVVLENIVRYVEQGMKPFDAAIKGATEIGFTVLSITMSLVAVFIPILFMGGIVGRFFFEFAMTISIAILLSGFVSLTLTPMLASRLLKHKHGEEAKADLLSRVFEKGYDLMARGYRVTLDASLKVPVAHAAGDARHHRRHRLGVRRRQEGLPAHRGHQHHHRAHRGGTGHRLPGHAGAPAPGCRAHPARSRRALHQFERGAELLQSHAQPRLDLRAAQGARRRARTRAASADVQTRLRRNLAGMPGIRAFPVPLQNLRIGSRGGAALYQYTLTSVNQTELYDNAQRLIDRVKQAPGFTDVTRDLTLGARQLTLNVDRDALGRATALRWISSARRSTRRSAIARSPPSTRRPTTMRSSSRPTRRARSIPPCCRRCMCAPTPELRFLSTPSSP